MKKKSKSSFDTFGSIGKLASILQSATVKLGTISENIVYQQLLNNGYLSINDFLNNKSISLENSVNKKSKNELVANEFLNNFNSSDKYVGQKISFEYEGKKIQADILIYLDSIFYIFEVKSSTSFDTKKSPAEVNSLFSNTLALQKLLLKQNNDSLKKCLVKGYVCCLDAENKQEIFTGFKNYVKDNELMWKNEDFKNIMTGQLTIVKRKDLINESDMSNLLKAFVESDINSHSVFSNNIIKAYGIYVLTGKEFYSKFGLDFSNLKFQRENEARNVLLATINEKAVDIDKETIDLIKIVHNNFLENDIVLKKKKIVGEQFNLFE